MKIAIVGSGISGLVSAHLLHPDHEVTLFEAAEQAGGHTLTVDVELWGRSWAVDTGFVVFNQVTYPRFVALLDELGVASQPTDMSFGVRCERSGIEYCGSGLSHLFAQRRNLLRPSFLRMVRDILRFNREGNERVQRIAAGAAGDPSRTLADLLAEGGYSRAFVDLYVVPMGAAIWSTSPRRMLDFPADFFLHFLANHRLMTVDGHLLWRVVAGGSRSYVDAIVRPLGDRVRLATPVRRIVRHHDRVEIEAGGERHRFDQVIVATHSDQALRLLADPSQREREILGAMTYQPNRAVLHTDTSLLAENRRARASWNYHVPRDDREGVVVTYDMSRLMGLDTPRPFLVSLNPGDRVDPRLVLRQLEFSHPLFTPEAVAAQRRHHEISGQRRTHFCGAYWRNGFHEDGVVSAQAVVAGLGGRSLIAA